MKKIGIALILTCALSVSALAGDIPTIGKTPPPPPTTESTIAGDVPTIGKTSTSSSIVTTIFLTVLSLIR